jgi:Na+/H+-dicarboxylate symporter
MDNPKKLATLLARTVASSKDTGDEFRHLGLFILTALLGFLMWSLIVSPAVYFAFKRTNPFRFLFTLLCRILEVF